MTYWFWEGCDDGNISSFFVVTSSNDYPTSEELGDIRRPGIEALMTKVDDLPVERIHFHADSPVEISESDIAFMKEFVGRVGFYDLRELEATRQKS